MEALNPVFKVGSQVAEAINLHQRIGDSKLEEKVIELLGRMRLPDPASHPHPRGDLAPVAEDLRSFGESLAAEIEGGRFGREAALGFVRKLQGRVAGFSDRLTVAYFSHAVDE